MKRVALSIFVLLSTFAQGQYAPVGTRWDFSFMSGPYENMVNHPVYRHSLKQLVVEKDTLILGKTFSKISGNAPGPGFLRGENRKVFYWFDGKECLLIDFNAMLGDTLNLDIFIRGSNTEQNKFQVLPHKVAIVDTVYYIPNPIQNDSLKTIGFHFNIDSSEMAQTWHTNPFYYHFTEKVLNVEILCNSYFLGDRVGTIFPSSELHALRCFNSPGYTFSTSWWQNYWVKPYNFPCDYQQPNLYAKTLFDSLCPFNFYPNPVNDKLTFEMGVDEFSVSVYSINGTKLVEIYFPYAGKYELPLEISSGIYQIEVKLKTGIVSHYKFVKN